MVGFGQTQESLSDILWNSVNSCYSNFEDMNDDGVPDFKKIDDSKNGYLQISGSWPTCGCSCSSTVGAYKNSKGKYVLLQSDRVLCSWERRISSNKNLSEILPKDFGINEFTIEKINNTFGYSIFFFEIEIPRIGTDTKVKIELVPFGLKPEEKKLGCFSYKELERFSNCKSLYEIERIARKIESDETIDHILSGNFEKISENDYDIVEGAIGTSSSRFDSKAELQKYCFELEEIFKIYQSLDCLEIVLGWNREESKFYVKEKKGSPSNISFREFLKTNKYWSPNC